MVWFGVWLVFLLSFGWAFDVWFFGVWLGLEWGKGEIGCSFVGDSGLWFGLTRNGLLWLCGG